MNENTSPEGLRETTLRDGSVVRWRRNGSGPPLVFCHGTPWSSDLWEHVAAALPGWTTYLWDMPGFGRSGMATGADLSLAAQGERFAELLDRWGVREPSVIAHDIGGAVALSALLEHSRGLARLILVDVVTLRPWGSPFFRLVRDHPEVFGALPGDLHAGLVGAYVAGASHRGLDDDTLGDLTRPWRSAAGQAAFYTQIAHADPADTDLLVARLGHVGVPTTVIWGEEDTWIPAEQARRLAAAIPGARLRIIPAAGHLVQVDAPEALLEAIREALERPAAARTERGRVVREAHQQQRQERP